MFYFVLVVIAFYSSFVNGADEYTCTALPTHKNTSTILKNLRYEMQNANISVYVIFSDDEHGSEYTQPYDKRRDWITGFRGSAGTAVVTWRSAALWTDGRYFTQAEEELDCANWFLMRDGNPGVPKLIDWIVSEANQTELVSYSIRYYLLNKCIFISHQGLQLYSHLHHGGHQLIMH
jgi:Xaa-Pro aminopeptidase